MKKTKVVTKLIAIILSILVVVQVAPMSTFAETIETESEKFEESGYSTEVSQEEEDPIVIGEDVDRRDSSNTKYFKMSDGTIKAAVYKDPVLYQDSAGKWQEIDNTLETSDNENDELSNFNGYATKSNKFRVKFAKNSNQKKLVSIKMGDYSVSLSLLNKTKKNNSSMKQEKKAKIEDLTAASKASQKIYYENILMYDGQKETVTLFCNNDMMNYVIDRFGDEVKTSPVDCEHFEAVAEVSVSQTFFAWVFQFNGDIKIIEPEPVVVKYREMLRNALEGRAVTVGR